MNFQLKHKVNWIVIALLVFFNFAWSIDAAAAEKSSIKIEKTLFYKERAVPEEIDNYQYSLYYSNGKKLYNLRGFEIAETPMDILRIRINPAGHSLAAIISNGRRATVVTYDINFQKRRLAQVKAFAAPAAIEYTADSRTLVVADGNSLHLLDAITMNPKGEISLPFIPLMLAASSEGFIAAADLEKVAIISTDRNRVIRTLEPAGGVEDILFDESGSIFGVLTREASLQIFDGHTFNSLYSHPTPSQASSFSFHPDGKYVAINHHDNRIKFMNLMEPSDSISLKDAEGFVKNARFLRNGKGEDFIAYNTNYSLKYIQLSGFIPNYTRQLEERLNAKMAEWTKMRPFETAEQYALRVNDESISRQKQLFANEIATSLAGDLISRADVKLGDYNPDSGHLALNISGMNDVFLEVPRDEVLSFSDASNLEFRNVVYALTPSDKFEIIYAEVFNPGNGKTYKFDNLSRQNLAFLATEDSFIPLELIRQSSREDAQLQTIKDEVVASAITNNLISDHTKIQVSADIIPAFNEDGERIKNYKIDFNYTVDPEYSASEDFAPGKYMVSESHAAGSMLDIVAQAFETELKQYLQPGRKLIVNITGSADAIPILRLIKYDGRFGEFECEPCRIGNDLSSISVNTADGIRKNEQLAFIRTQAVKAAMLEKTPAIGEMDVDYNYRIGVSDQTGGEHRRINVSLIFVDVF